ncbi:mitochondrial atp synthase coupling factor b [Holotrichia oblita]|uniref:Mitochondrial atp synthase coupling factor b n=1 Tax=Holotrichia oblita TaxID=644536 RepID=A0ACB9TSD4_HOLOL|nr:mitochondrial atp synthase coupling factor b [Holotrichia oblita]
MVFTVALVSIPRHRFQDIDTDVIQDIGESIPQSNKLIMFTFTRRRILPVVNTQICLYTETSKDVKPITPDVELAKQSAVSGRETSSEVTSSDSIKWRTPWHQKEGQYYSVLRTFYSEHNNTKLMKLIQAPIDLSPSAIRRWWADKKKFNQVVMQQYIPERNRTLGNELAAAHFIVYRGGSVKFFGQDFWIKANQFNRYQLPNRFEADWQLQAIDCSGMELHYEGLVNLRDLEKIEWFSVRGCENMDDWCMDRISNIFARTLLYLDIRDCPNITHRGLAALVKMSKLKIVYLDDITYTNEYEMTCLMLQQVLPDLDIRIE